MIVLPAGESLWLITQPDHAALARRIMERWSRPDLTNHSRRASIMYAIEHHDDGWSDVDARPTVIEGTGQVADFINAPLAIRQGVWPRCVSRLGDDPFAAALVAEHALHIYARYRANPSWSTFFTEMERLRAQYAEVAAVPLQDLQRDYAFLRIADLISLVFCNRWTEPREDFDFSIRCDGERVVVKPYPFGNAPLPLEVQARTILNRAYASDEDLRSAVRDARNVMLTGEVAPA